MPIYISLTYLCAKVFKQTTWDIKNNFKRLIFIALTLQALFFSILMVSGKSKSLDYYFIAYGFLGTALSLSVIYFSQIRKKTTPFFLSALITLTPLSYIFLRIDTKFEPVVKFIKEHYKENNSARDTYVIADDYSQFGYLIWNRVMKYKWVIVKENLDHEDYEKIFKNEKYKYFIFNKHNKIEKEAIGIGKGIGLNHKMIGETTVLYK